MEIERKFLATNLPPSVLHNVSPTRYERYYLSLEPVEKRVQRVDDRYYYEEKRQISDLSHAKLKKEITVGEFNELRKHAQIPTAIVRDSYAITDSPHMSIKMYHGAYEGLIRAEIEFRTEDEATDYTPPSWITAEITNTPLGKDSRLITLKPAEFQCQLTKFRG